jgi:peroxiredoxin
MELQDLLIDRFVEHRWATAEGQEERVKTLDDKSTVFCVKRKRSKNGRQ